MKNFLIVCLAVLAFQTQGAFAADKVINWYHANFPPGFILSGPMKGDGYENYLEHLLRDSLQDYEHKYRVANYSRILEQIRSTNACCVALLRKPEREEYVEYSQPTMIALSNGLFIQKDRIEEFKPYMDDEGYISIDKLFYESDFRMGVSKGRRYGEPVDRIVDIHSKSKKLLIRGGEDVLEGLLDMLDAQRGVDYVVGYPHEIRWLNYMGMLKEDFTFIPIREMPKYVISQIGCSKNAWGKEVIRQINQLLADGYIPEYKERYQRFLPPEAIVLHEKYIKEVFN